MNRQRSPKSSPQRQSRPSPQGFTAQQILILILVGGLGLAGLGLAVLVLFSGEPSSSAAGVVPTSQAGQKVRSAAVPSPTWTAPANASQAVRTPIPPLPASCAQSGREFSQGIVIRIIDSGTFEFEDAGKLLQASYAGIELPRTDMPPGSQPGELTAGKEREWLQGQPVILVKDQSEQDTTGRLLRYVFTGDRFINYELVRQGLAVAQPNSPDRACAAYLQEAELQARAEHLGVWKVTPVPTLTFMPFVTIDSANQCDCSKKYTCSDFKTHAAAQACLNVCNDYSSKLDEDRDGIACENLP